MGYQVLKLLDGFVINWLNFLKFILKVILMLTTLYPPLVTNLHCNEGFSCINM